MTNQQITHAREKLSLLKAYRDDLRVTRAQLSAILDVSWVRVSQMVYRFDVSKHEGELLISLSSVEEYYAASLRKKDQPVPK